jgi:hypothetical protein
MCIRDVVVNKLNKDYIELFFGEWLLGGEPCFALNPGIRIKKTSVTFFVIGSHHGSTSTKTTNFTENIQYVLTEFADSHSGVTEDSCRLGW